MLYWYSDNTGETINRWGSNHEKYYDNRHSCFLLQYHLALVNKYRHPVITGDFETRLLEYTRKYFKERSCVINTYKSASSRILMKEYPDILRKYYWIPYFWNLSNFIGSVSNRTETAAKSYIEHQKDEAFTHDWCGWSGVALCLMNCFQSYEVDFPFSGFERKPALIPVIS